MRFAVATATVLGLTGAASAQGIGVPGAPQTRMGRGRYAAPAAGSSVPMPGRPGVGGVPATGGSRYSGRYSSSTMKSQARAQGNIGGGGAGGVGGRTSAQMRGQALNAGRAGW
jgi:hypothetical protein